MRDRGWFRRAPGDRGLASLLRVAVGLAAAGFLVALVPGPTAAPAASAGVAVLLSAPFLATLSAAVTGARRGRVADAALAALLLAALLAGVWLGSL